MNRIALNIRNRLSLRTPQVESLAILELLADMLTLEKEMNLEEDLAKVKSVYPTCTSFERDFPSICFALATGVGKTRLMGAFITYLHLQKGINNFFIMAPNLTIYNKLTEDFGNPAHPKYVFKGIAEFAQNKPRIITGDNYDQGMAQDLLTKVSINIFNISKLNAETRGGAEPRIKRLKEYIGDSYFDYLASLPDLVLLMDESHHYRADRGMAVINELKPVLGLELTATPKTERGGKSILFENVVYEYSLAKAVNDGYVKDPAVATRKDFDPSKYRSDPDRLDEIKLQDGIRIHEDTKLALDKYSRDFKTKSVKPFVLVVAKDTEHAAKIKEMIASQGFFDGYYADKVMEIHSNQRGSEKEENIQQLLSLESPENPIEVVIHVNMLKEGWDVTNLYTIIPLRASASETLTEQTIGRGLRLPYGKRTGVQKVDKLTIVAHDKFQAIIDEANKEDSIIRKENVIIIEETDMAEKKEIVTGTDAITVSFEVEQKKIDTIEDESEKKKATARLETKKLVWAALPEMNRKVRSVSELKTEEVKKAILENVGRKVYGTPQQDLFAEERMIEIQAVMEEIVDEFGKNIIEIPRITIQQSGNTIAGFHDFNLDTEKILLRPVSEDIRVQMLRQQKEMVDIVKGEGKVVPDSLENILVNELINHDEIDYDQECELLFKLAGQAIDKLKSYLNEGEVINVVQFRKRELSDYIFTQMMEHFYVKSSGFDKPLVYPFSGIKDHNLSKHTSDKIFPFRETIEPTNSIPTKVFTGFSKAYHTMCKVDSKTEKDFAIILEDDKDNVLKWLRPAQGQFHIYYQHNSRQYNPDFIVETNSEIFMIETKKADDVDSSEVQDKARSAIEYCRNATEYTSQNGGKPWKYVLIPHNAVQLNMSFDFLVREYVI